MQALIDRYIARLVSVPLAATLLVSAMLMIMVRMAQLFDLVLDGGGDAMTALRMMVNLAPQYLALAIPLALFMGVLLAFRGLALDRELDALIGTGISYVRLLRTPMLYATSLCIIMWAIVGFLQPLGVYGYEKMLFELGNGSMGVSLRAREFNALGNDLVVRAERVRRSGRDLSKVFAALTAEDGRLTVFSAARAELFTSGAGGTPKVRLYDGHIARVDPVSGTSQRASFASYDVPLSLPEGPVFRARGIHERELTLPELIRSLRDPASGALARAQAEAGLYRRVAQAAVLFFLPLLAVALARPPSRSASSFGLILGVAGVIVYNELSLFGERLGFTAQVAPLPAQAASFVPFAGICVALFMAFALLPGTPPLGRVAGVLARFGRDRRVGI